MSETAIDGEQLAGLCRAALDALSRPTIICDADKILFANDAAVRLLRAPSIDDVVGRSISDLVHPDMSTPGHIRRTLIVECRQHLLGLPAKVISHDGTTIAALVDARPIEYEGVIAIVYSVAADVGGSSPVGSVVTDPGVTRSDMFSASLEVLPDILLIHDDATILFANLACRRVLGAQSPEDLEGRPIELIVHPDATAAGRQRRRLLLDGDSSLKNIPLKVLGLDGLARHLTADAYPLANNGIRAGMVVVNAIVD